MSRFDLAPGDIILTGKKSQGIISIVIKFGSKLRFGFRSPHTQYSHSAIVYETDETGSAMIVEAVEKGVIKRPMHYSEGDYAIVKTSALADDRDIEQMRRFLDNVLAHHERYGRWQFAGLALYCLTGTGIAIHKAGTSICSGLCCNAAMVWGAFPSGACIRPPLVMMPAHISKQATDEGVPVLAT